MKLYFVELNDDVDTGRGGRAFATKKEAMEFRRDLYWPDGEVRAVTLANMPMRELMAALWNGSGYGSGDSKVVAPPKRKTLDDPDAEIPDADR